MRNEAILGQTGRSAAHVILLAHEDIRQPRAVYINCVRQMSTSAGFRGTCGHVPRTNVFMKNFSKIGNEAILGQTGRSAAHLTCIIRQTNTRSGGPPTGPNHASELRCDNRAGSFKALRAHQIGEGDQHVMIVIALEIEHFLQRRKSLQRSLINALGRHGIERIDNRHDLAEIMHILEADAARVTIFRAAFMMLQDRVVR